jgi:hypothetical protein
LFLNNDPAQAVSSAIIKGSAIRFTSAPRLRGK